MIPPQIAHQITESLAFADQAVRQYTQYPSEEFRRARLSEIAEARKWVSENRK